MRLSSVAAFRQRVSGVSILWASNFFLVIFGILNKVKFENPRSKIYSVIHKICRRRWVLVIKFRDFSHCVGGIGCSSKTSFISDRVRSDSVIFWKSKWKLSFIVYIYYLDLTMISGTFYFEISFLGLRVGNWTGCHSYKKRLNVRKSARWSYFLKVWLQNREIHHVDALGNLGFHS